MNSLVDELAGLSLPFGALPEALRDPCRRQLDEALRHLRRREEAGFIRWHGSSMPAYALRLQGVANAIAAGVEDYAEAKARMLAGDKRVTDKRLSRVLERIIIPKMAENLSSALFQPIEPGAWPGIAHPVHEKEAPHWSAVSNMHLAKGAFVWLVWRKSFNEPSEPYYWAAWREGLGQHDLGIGDYTPQEAVDKLDEMMARRVRDEDEMRHKKFTQSELEKFAGWKLRKIARLRGLSAPRRLGILRDYILHPQGSLLFLQSSAQES